MIKVTVGNNVKRESVIIDESTTCVPVWRRTVLTIPVASCTSTGLP